MVKLKRRAKKRAARKGVKMTAKHMVRGTASKTRRAPLRTGGLLSLGALLGASVTWIVARGRARPRVAT
jgi:hypothetical protein